MKVKQLWAAKDAFESILRAYIARELVNIDTYGNWTDDDGVYFERFLGEKPLFVSWESLDIWAEKHYAEAVV